MVATSDSFGQALIHLMRTHGVTVEALKDRMHIKSKTTITRILHNQCSVKRAASFLQELYLLNPIVFTEAEWGDLRQALHISSYGVDRYQALQTVATLLSPQEQPKDCICTACYGDASDTPRTLRTWMARYAAMPQVEIYVLNAFFDTVTKPLEDLLSTASQATQVYHFFSDQGTEEGNARLFLSLMNLLYQPRYQLYLLRSAQVSVTPFDTGINHMIVAIGHLPGGEYTTDVLSFQSPQAYTMLCQLPGQYAAQFYRDIFTQRMNQHPALKHASLAHPPLLSWRDAMRQGDLLETSWSEMTVKQDFAFKMVPPEIIAQIFAETQTWKKEDTLHLEQDCMDVFHRRYRHYAETSRQCMNIFTRQGMESFAHSGRVTDHPRCMRAFTPTEIKGILQDLIGVCLKNPANGLRMLKGENPFGRYAFTFYDRSVMSLYDGQADDDAPFCLCLIYASTVINPFYAFVKELLLVEHTYSQEESIAFLRQLLQQV